MTWSAAEVERTARNLVDELNQSRPVVAITGKEERWESDYEQKHCYDLLKLHYESGDPYESNRWKYQPIRRMDEAERCFFEDWAD